MGNAHVHIVKDYEPELINLPNFFTQTQQAEMKDQSGQCAVGWLREMALSPDNFPWQDALEFLAAVRAGTCKWVILHICLFNMHKN